jgi:hypothetical protein
MGQAQQPGRLGLDAFVSRRSTYIGPEGVISIAYEAGAKTMTFLPLIMK